MKYLLTSGGVRNPSIHNALLEMLNKPITECKALCIPTATYAHPMSGPNNAWRFISGQSPAPMTNLGWETVGVLELTTLPTIDKERWVRWVQETDVLLVDGGDALYLCHWMQQSGLADLLPSLKEMVWVGISAGSMVVTPRIGEEFVNWKPPSGDDSTLGIVDFSIFPHLDLFPNNTMTTAEKWVTKIGIPGYVMDDETAIKVIDGEAEVVSEGQWKLLTP
jgi:dipeptidase E